jgi:hypothetical protein
MKSVRAALGQISFDVFIATWLLGPWWRRWPRLSLRPAGPRHRPVTLKLACNGTSPPGTIGIDCDHLKTLVTDFREEAHTLVGLERVACDRPRRERMRVS